MLNHPYIILVPMDGYTSCYGHVKQGHGKAARRQPLFAHRVEIPLTRSSLPDVLRALAALLDEGAFPPVPSARSAREPRGAVGGVPNPQP